MANAAADVILTKVCPAFVGWSCLRDRKSISCPPGDVPGDGGGILALRRHWFVDLAVGRVNAASSNRNSSLRGIRERVAGVSAPRTCSRRSTT